MRPEDEEAVRQILRKHVPDREVWLFGSRAGGDAKPYSDLDLLILGDAQLPTRTLIALKDAFEESDLPFQVDVVEWASISERFRRVVSAQHTVFQTAETGARPHERSATQAG